MKKGLVYLFAPFLLIGCAINGDDNCMPKTIASEQASMEALATSQGMTFTQHSSGILFEVINPGAGMTADHQSKIFVRYTGKLKDGTIIDQVTDHTQTGWILGGMIPGWQLAVPLIQEGGRIKVVIPSSLAYGCEYRGTIPSHSILYFDIELVDVQ